MLTFLRKIRRSLIQSGSVRRYLLYALGEILLVMIGILLALQVNNWNEGRKNRIHENNAVEELYEELIQNLNYTKTELELTQLQNEALEQLLSKKGQESYDSQALMDSNLLLTSLSFEVYSPIINKTQEIASNGDFTFSRSGVLKNRLSSYLSQIYELQEFYQYNADTWKTVVRPYLIKNYSSRSLVKHLLPENLHSTKFESSPDKILSDKEFDNILMHVYGDLSPYISALKDNIIAMESLISLISSDYAHVDKK